MTTPETIDKIQKQIFDLYDQHGLSTLERLHLTSEILWFLQSEATRAYIQWEKSQH